MPAYISHAIMGEDLYREASRLDDYLKVDVELAELRGYSLGADLAFLSKKVIKDPHIFRTRDFFITLIKYIKTNKLAENERVMALLYGHMAHYFFDVNTHPLIYYIECGCEKVGLLSNHDLIEGYLSSYLAKRVLNKDIMDIGPEYFGKVCLDDTDVFNLLNNVYGIIYNDREIVNSYKTLMVLFFMLEKVIKSGFISKNLLINFSCFREFLEKNNLTEEEILNNGHNNFRNPVTGDICRDSFMDSYYKSIDMSLSAMEMVNRCLYDGYGVGILDNTFTDLSYYSGVPCSLGERYAYVRKLKRIVGKK